MTLGEKQRKFTYMISQLILWVYEHMSSPEVRYELTFGDAYAQSGHMKNSLHYLRLAIVLNLFINGEYQASTVAHEPIGEKWESMGGTWGGRFQDGNHYSLEHEGRK
jgi:hypothetical protein